MCVRGRSRRYKNVSRFSYRRNLWIMRVRTYACVRNNAPTVFRTVPSMAILRQVELGTGFEISDLNS